MIEKKELTPLELADVFIELSKATEGSDTKIGLLIERSEDNNYLKLTVDFIEIYNADLVN